MTYKVDLLVEGIDLRSDVHDRALSDGFQDVFWHSTDQLTFATVVSESDIVNAVCDVSNRLQHSIDGARFIRVDEEFVGVTDIASRLEVGRETVRLWSLGKRGPGNFPATRGVLGSAGGRGPIKFWAWADVNEWLSQLGLDDSFAYPNASQVAQINVYLARVPEPEGSDYQRLRVRTEVPMAPHPDLVIHQLAKALFIRFADVDESHASIYFMNGGSKHGLYKALKSEPQADLEGSK